MHTAAELVHASLGLFPSRGAPTLFLPGGPKAPGPADDAPDSSSGASSPSREAGGPGMSYIAAWAKLGRGEGLLPKMHLVHCVWYFVVYVNSTAKPFT